MLLMCLSQALSKVDLLCLTDSLNLLVNAVLVIRVFEKFAGDERC